MSNSFDDDNFMDETRRKSMSLSIEEIREQAQGDYTTLVHLFLIEESGGKNAFEMSQTWERWLPLVRDEAFLRVFEQVTSEIEAGVPDEIHRRAFQQKRNMARDINRMTEEEARNFFANRNDQQKFDAARPEDLARAEYDKGVKAAARGDLIGARIHYEHAIDAFAGQKNDQMRAQSILNLAAALGRAGQLSEAEKLYKQAAAIFKRLDDTNNLGLAFHNLGNSMFMQHQLEQAYQFAEQGLRALILSKPGADDVAKLCVNLMLQVADCLPLHEQLDHYRKIAQVLEELKLQRSLGRAYLQMAGVLIRMKQFNEGSEVATKGVKLILASNAPPEEVQWALHMHMLIWNAMGRPGEEWVRVSTELLGVPDEVTRLGDIFLALATDVDAGKLHLDEAKRRLREIHAREPFNIQAVATHEWNMRHTLQHFERLPAESLHKFVVGLSLLILATELTDTSSTGSALYLSLGQLYDHMDQFSEAAQAFQDGAELARLSNNTEFHITMRLNSAVALRRAGEWTSAIDHLESLLAELRAVDATARQPEINLELATLYQEQGNLREAEGVTLNGLHIIAGLQGLEPQVVEKLEATEADLHTVLGLIHKHTDRYASAEKHLQSSLDLYHKLKNYEKEVKTLGNLASVRLALHDMEGALRLYNLAYQMSERLLPSPSYIFIYLGRAVVLSIVGQIAEARHMALRALQMNPPVEQAMQCVCVLMDAATNDAEGLDARRLAEQLLQVNPAPLAQLPILARLVQQAGASPEQKREWQIRLRQIGDSLEGLQGAYVHLGIADQQDDTPEGRREAIEHLERGIKLIDEVAGSNPDRAIQRDIFTTGNRAAQRLLQLKSADDRTCFEIVLRTKARATLNQSFMTARTLNELQKQLSQQQGPVLLVEMYVLPTESLLYFVTSDGLRGVERLPITAEVLMAEDRIITRLGDIQYHKTAWQSKTWMRVSTLFGDALKRYLRPKQLVCLVPAGFWHFLPLHACLLHGRPLIESHPVYYGPSSSILFRPGEAQRRLQRCLAVGVEFEREAEWVADWFGGRAVLESAAEPTAVAILMVDQDVVHFSCHGAYNPWLGSESGLVLAHRSWLTPTLIEQWTTAADLVTLSACETAFDFVTAGNDVVGLDQALLNMGAVSVLGTLWKVEAVSTEDFVKAFYKHLTGKRGSRAKQMSKAHALQAAVAQVRTNKRFDHPFYWAPFKLTGGWL